MDPTQAYSSRAVKYAKYRWDYAPQAIQAILDVTRISTEATIADIGAGTGILTKHFAGIARRVFAIEPNAEMRHMAARILAPYPACRTIDARAEATTLPDHSIDLITVAQAIHWFEPETAREEFLRILKADGWLAILRNYETDKGLRDAVAQILTQEQDVDPSQTNRPAARKPLCFFYGSDDFQRLTFSFTIQETWEEFMGALSSASYSPPEDSPLYAKLERAAREVFDRFGSAGLLAVHGATELCLGQPVHRFNERIPRLRA